MAKLQITNMAFYKLTQWFWSDCFKLQNPKFN